MHKLDQLLFENTFARLPDSFHSRLKPTPLPAPYLVSFNANAARLIDLDIEEFSRADFAEHFTGNRLLPGAEPLSMLYAGQHEQIIALADYVIARHFPHLVDDADKYQLFLHEVTQRTAKLMAQWQAVGFSPGVMNTDNMSILGLTFDYGPFGFMESYDPGYICNHSDPRGRYAYDQQPQIGLWNLACLCL